MEKTIISIMFAVAAALSLVSCQQPSAVPPLNDGYATRYVMPDPVDLTVEEREYIESLRQEYNDAIRGN